MTTLDLTRDVSSTTDPIIHRINADDLHWALRRGWDDFQAKRGDLIFVSFIYPLIGLITGAIALDSKLLPYLFPIVAGISILGPVVAAGFYEIARRRDEGDDTGWAHFLDPIRPGRRGGLIAITSMLIALFLAWLLIASVIYQATLGQLRPIGVGAFLRDLLTTSEGWTLIVVGNLAGGLIAALTLVLTVVSAPMVVDRPDEPELAVRTSIRAVAANPGAIARWGAIVAGLLILGTIPLFVGLAVVLPVLGYSTWHLYTRLVER